MITAFLLLFVGLLLIFFEFFLPGGIMGAAGALAMIGSVIVFAMDAPSPLYIVGYMVLAGVLLGLVIKFSLWRIRTGKKGHTVYLQSDQEGFRSFKYDEEAIGKEGIAHSDLKPSGHIKVDGKRYQAIAKTGYIKKGSPIEVIEGKGAHLVVKLSNKGNESC